MLWLHTVLIGDQLSKIKLLEVTIPPLPVTPAYLSSYLNSTLFPKTEKLCCERAWKTQTEAAALPPAKLRVVEQDAKYLPWRMSTKKPLEGKLEALEPTKKTSFGCFTCKNLPP